MIRRVLTKADAKVIRENNTAVPILDGTQVEPATAATAQQAQPEGDGYATKLIKLIPAEVVTVFVTLDGIIRTAGKQVPAALYWAIFVFLTIATYFYMRRVTKVDGLPARKTEAVLASISFVVWVFAIGGPFTFDEVKWYLPVYGAILLPLYTFAVPMVFPAKNA